jgi:RNA 3'-terminal phosphate cyclase (ATP)
MVEIDGAQGEGGGQVLRTALVLSALTGQPLRMRRIRANRANPGLAPQHLTVIRALARVCGAALEGAALRATELEFRPQYPPQAGVYDIDVAEAATGGSAGSVTLVLQAMHLALAYAAGSSRVRLVGGTHVPRSPAWHFLAHVYLPTVAGMGLRAETQLERWGFYPVGQGVITAEIEARGRPLAPITLERRGPMRRVWGVAVAANLPAHIPQRIAARADKVLAGGGLRPHVQAPRERAAGPGAGLFLVAEYEGSAAGFAALGERGKPSEQVAEEASLDLLANHASGQPVDMHLADQLLLPAALAAGRSSYATCRLTQHTLTNADVIRQFLPVEIVIEGQVAEGAVVRVGGVGWGEA